MDRIVATKRQLAETERDFAELEVTDADAKWMLGVRRDLANAWSLMTPEDRVRLLRALVVAVRVREETGVVEIELMNFGADTRSQEVARRRKRCRRIVPLSFELFCRAWSGYHAPLRRELHTTKAESMTIVPWTSVEEVAKHLGVKGSVCRWIESRSLPTHKIGRL